MRRARLTIVLPFIAIACGLAYLRDPAWLADQTTGLRAWQRSGEGAMFRWSGGHASFFVPADARAIRVPIATTFPDSAPPMVVTFFVDGVRAAGVILTDGTWREVVVPMPPPGWRRVRRIDVRTSVTREDNHGVKVGRVQVIRAAGVAAMLRQRSRRSIARS
jgi:hypothetical protein